MDLARIAAALAATALLGLALSSCGGSSSTATAAARAGANGDSARLKFAQCMRKNGVNIPDPTPGAGGPPRGAQRLFNRNDPQFRKAFTTCGKILRAAFGNITPAQRQQFQARLLKLTQCLRAHGLDVPDPQFNADGRPGGPGPGGFLRFGRNDPKARAALQACRNVLPRPPGGGVRFGPGGPAPN